MALMGKSARSSIIKSIMISTGTSMSRCSNSCDRAAIDSKGSSITKSRSRVVRGSPHAQTATAPPIKYFTLAASRACNTSRTKSAKDMLVSDIDVSAPDDAQRLDPAKFGSSLAKTIGRYLFGQFDHGNGLLETLGRRQVS